MENIDEIFTIATGQILKKYRKEKKYSLEDVTKKMKNNITRQSLFKYEKGIARMKLDIFIDICNVLNLSPADIFKEINEQAFLTSIKIKDSGNFEKAIKEFIN